MSDMPAPETTEAKLLNRAGQFTRHKYDHTEELPTVGIDRRPDGTGYSHFFRCTETGALRVFGHDGGGRGISS